MTRLGEQIGVAMGSDQQARASHRVAERGQRTGEAERNRLDVVGVSLPVDVDALRFRCVAVTAVVEGDRVEPSRQRLRKRLVAVPVEARRVRHQQHRSVGVVPGKVVDGDFDAAGGVDDHQLLSSCRRRRRHQIVKIRSMATPSRTATMMAQRVLVSFWKKRKWILVE